MTRLPAVRRMRLLVTGALALCAMALTVSACSDDDDGDNTLPCGLDTGNSEISGDITVGYSAALTGAGTVTSITYTDNSGDVVVTNPTLPARIRAAGSVTSGSIVIGYSATGAPDRAEQDSQTCEQIAN